MVSTSSASKSLSAMQEAAPASSSRAYPAPLAKYEEVVENPKTFMFTLEKLHHEMGTKFMIPIIEGRQLDLHQLFVHVTCLGGIEKVIKDKKWNEITATFNLPSIYTRASFVLRKYYTSLLFHYEQVYYFRSPGWASPTTSDALRSQPTMPSPVQTMQSPQLRLGIQSPAFHQSSSNVAELREDALRSQPTMPSPVQTMQSPQLRLGIQSPAFHQSSSNVAELREGSSVTGVIDEKCESGYMITVTVGSEKFKGLLYHPPQNSTFSASHPIVSVNIDNVSGPSGVRRRGRRKKAETERKDPAQPKPKRNGYNFFFGEQFPRLKSLHQGKDRNIRKMVADLWKGLNEWDKAVYQEMGVKDKERYDAEMEDYNKKLNTGQVIFDAMPLQQILPEQDTDMVDAEAEVDYLQTPEEYSSGEGEYDVDMDASHSIGESSSWGQRSN